MKIRFHSHWLASVYLPSASIMPTLTKELGIASGKVNKPYYIEKNVKKNVKISSHINILKLNYDLINELSTVFFFPTKSQQ